MKNKNDLDKEIRIIKAIAKNNGYRSELIDKIINNLENKKAELKDENEYLEAIPYIDWVKNRYQSIYKQYKINIGISYNQSLINVISNNKTKIKHRDDLSGVYKINCENVIKFILVKLEGSSPKSK